jgi:hypothetical protein
VKYRKHTLYIRVFTAQEQVSKYLFIGKICTRRAIAEQRFQTRLVRIFHVGAGALRAGDEQRLAASPHPETGAPNFMAG